MKVLIEPRSGKCGLIVWQQGRYGQIARTLAIPTNPQTGAQRTARNNLTLQSRAWALLTQAQRDAWTATAGQLQSNARLGMSGALTGNQLFTRINCNLLTIGGSTVSDPPAIPQFTAMPITSLEATWTGGTTFKLDLNTTASPPDGSMLRAAPPCSAGRYSSPGKVFLGTLGSPVGNKIDVTTVYTGRYGVPAVGQRIFVSVNANVDGYEDLPLEFTCIVPAKA